ncbi:site-specific integrase [Burkholderia ubonensis]|uniref:site-specific integrase n=1 Tax=Burkholderia ubonensis TaxID=101571 RepID=UPI00211630A2|nr:site-specific integrase [Burkholderia ubonensis]
MEARDITCCPLSGGQVNAARSEIAPFRKYELLKLEWSRVDFDRAVLSLEPSDTKNGKRRVVPLNDEAMAALRDQREWVRVTVPRSPWVFAVASGDRMTTIQKGFRAVCVRAGIDDFRVHDLRHTFASWLVMAGVSLYVVKDLLGHSSIRVTEDTRIWHRIWGARRCERCTPRCRGDWMGFYVK